MSPSSLEVGNGLSFHNVPFSNFLEYRTMNKAQNPINSEFTLVVDLKNGSVINYKVFLERFYSKTIIHWVFFVYNTQTLPHIIPSLFCMHGVGLFMSLFVTKRISVKIPHREKKRDYWNIWHDKIHGNNKLIEPQPRHRLTGEVFCGFTQFLRPHARIAPQIIPRLPPFTSFPIHYSLPSNHSTIYTESVNLKYSLVLTGMFKFKAARPHVERYHSVVSHTLNVVSLISNNFGKFMK
jgi:hypothetical protein